MAKELPPAPSLEHFKKQAKALLRGFQTAEPAALRLIKELHPECQLLSPEEVAQRPLTLSDVQLVIAHDYAFPSWPKLKAWLEANQHPKRLEWVRAIKDEDLHLLAARSFLAEHPAFANSCHLEFEDPWRKKKFPTSTLDYAAAGPWPQTRECREWNRSRTYNLDLIRLLLDHGARIEGDTHHGSCICWVQDREVAHLLVERGAPLNYWRPNGGTPLNFACWSRDPHQAAMLLSLGADPNSRDPATQESCLHYAAGCPATDCVRVLLDAGANPNVHCIANPNIESYTVNKLLPGPALSAETPLHRAALTADPDCIQVLLQAGADRALVTSTGETPLQWAVRAGHPSEVVELLTPS